jgi:hypothetical protein
MRQARQLRERFVAVVCHAEYICPAMILYIRDIKTMVSIEVMADSNIGDIVRPMSGSVGDLL